VTSHIQDVFSNVPVFPSLGNHESFPVDQFEGPGADNWLYSALGEMWSSFLDPPARLQFGYAGYYTQLIEKGFRLVALNTMYCDTDNFWLVLPNSSDVGGQISWFGDTLLQARHAGERVYVIGHIPFGSGSCHSAYGKAMHDLVSNYSDVVVGMFFGHTHHDQVRRARSPLGRSPRLQFQIVRDVATEQTPNGVLWISPSVTPDTNVYPTFRVFAYNRTTKEVLDIYQYRANFTEGNINGNLTFTLGYSMREEYRLNGVTPGDMQNLLYDMRTDDTLFFSYLHNFYAGHIFNQSTWCDAKCRHTVICEALSADGYLTRACVNNDTDLRGRLLEEIVTC